MALIICPDCGNKVSDKAKSCPKCGWSIQTEIKTEKNPQRSSLLLASVGMIAVIVLVAIVILLLHGFNGLFTELTKDPAKQQRVLNSASENHPVSTVDNAVKTDSVSKQSIPDKVDDNENISDRRLVGISMPNHSTCWKEEGGDVLKSLLEEDGYDVELEYAMNDASSQNMQIDKMISDGCRCLIVAPVNSFEMGDVIERAWRKGVPIINYDDLIMNWDHISYYVSYDKQAIGEMQARYIVEVLKRDYYQGPYTIEIVAWDPDDDVNSRLLYTGAMSVLRPYIKNGELIVRSGETQYDDVVTYDGDAEYAYTRIKRILEEYYSGDNELDAILVPNDSLAQGVMKALEESYDAMKKGRPILTGEGCKPANVNKIIWGEQSMSVYFGKNALATKAVEMAEAVMNGEKVPTNTSVANNGAEGIPAFFLTPTCVDINNYRKLLVDTNIYTDEELENPYY